jgi:hypothetical protein
MPGRHPNGGKREKKERDDTKERKRDALKPYVGEIE